MESPALMGRLYLTKTGANEISGAIRHWAKEAGSRVVRGDVLGEVETAKAIVEVEASADGWFYPLVAVGDNADVGAVIAVIVDRAGLDLEMLRSFAAPMQASSTTDRSRPCPLPGDNSDLQWTRKAELLTERHHLNRAGVAAYAGASHGRITENDVVAFIAAQSAAVTVDGSGARALRSGVERVLVIGSAGGGGAKIVIDSLARSPLQLAVGIVDSNASLHGRSVQGVSVIGYSDPDAVLEMYRRGFFDGAVLAFSRDVNARASVFLDLRARGVPFTNVIDPTANVRNSVTLGVGNVILGSSYVGPEAKIGDNNFLSSNTCIEHDCRLGSHNAFGPTVSFSGRVAVGDRVRFGTHIAIEPDVSIGSDSVIASSCVITADVPERSLVRARISYTVSPRTDPQIVGSYVL